MWLGPDDATYRLNPSRLVTSESHAMWELWCTCQGGGLGDGGRMPDEVLRQPAIMLDAFAVLTAAHREFKPGGAS